MQNEFLKIEISRLKKSIHWEYKCSEMDIFIQLFTEEKSPTTLLVHRWGVSIHNMYKVYTFNCKSYLATYAQGAIK